MRYLLVICTILAFATCKKTDPEIPSVTKVDNPAIFSGYFYGDNKTFEPMANRSLELAYEGSLSDSRTVVATTTTNDQGKFQFVFDKSNVGTTVELDLVDAGKEAGYKPVMFNIKLKEGIVDSFFIQAHIQIDVYLSDSYKSESSDSVYINTRPVKAFNIAENRGKLLTTLTGRLLNEYDHQCNGSVYYSDSNVFGNETTYIKKRYECDALPVITKVYLD